jgi:hypothetical protein
MVSTTTSRRVRATTSRRSTVRSIQRRRGLKVRFTGTGKWAKLGGADLAATIHRSRAGPYHLRWTFGRQHHQVGRTIGFQVGEQCRATRHRLGHREPALVDHGPAASRAPHGPPHAVRAPAASWPPPWPPARRFPSACRPGRARTRCRPCTTTPAAPCRPPPARWRSPSRPAVGASRPAPPPAGLLPRCATRPSVRPSLR